MEAGTDGDKNRGSLSPGSEPALERDEPAKKISDLWLLLCVAVAEIARCGWGLKIKKPTAP